MKQTLPPNFNDHVKKIDMEVGGCNACDQSQAPVACRRIGQFSHKSKINKFKQTARRIRENQRAVQLPPLKESPAQGFLRQLVADGG